MDYLNSLISKWMPEGNQKVAVDSHPRLSGIMDTVNSTLAHGPETRLPKEFYNKKALGIIDKISVEEWFSGYQESQEYRSLGIGSLMGDLVERMVGSVEENSNDGLVEIGESSGKGRGGEKSIKMGLSGCHDTTLAAVLTSLGAFEGHPWPPYTSHIALELFKKSNSQQSQSTDSKSDTELPIKEAAKSGKSWFASIFNTSAAKTDVNGPPGIARKKLDKVSEAEISKLDSYYVRIRYNDEVFIHLEFRVIAHSF
jgi:acid phosphatase